MCANNHLPAKHTFSARLDDIDVKTMASANDLLSRFDTAPVLSRGQSATPLTGQESPAVIAALVAWARANNKTTNSRPLSDDSLANKEADAGVRLSPPVLSSTLQRTSVRDVSTPVLFDRTSSLADEQKFSFVHISKCGGASFISWALHDTNVRANGDPTFPHFYPQAAQGVEEGNLFDLEQRPGHFRLVMLRSPRSHVMSMFKECRFDPWGKSMISSRERHGEKPVPHHGTHLEDFTEWINYFLAANDT